MFTTCAKFIKFILVLLCVQIVAEEAVKITVDEKGPYVIHYDQLPSFMQGCLHDYLELQYNGKKVPIHVNAQTEKLRRGDSIFFYNYYRGSHAYILKRKFVVSQARWRKKFLRNAKLPKISSCINKKELTQNNINASLPGEKSGITPIAFDYKMWKRASRRGVLEIRFYLENILPATTSTVFIDLVHSYTCEAVGTTKIFINGELNGLYALSSLKKLQTKRLRRGGNQLRFELQPGTYLPVYLNNITVFYRGAILGSGQLTAQKQKYHIAIAERETYCFLSEDYVYQEVRNAFYCNEPRRIYFWRKTNFKTAKVRKIKIFRNKNAGANYIVIAPKNLQGILQRLVQWRKGQGHRFLFATPQEIYDTFGYGMANAAAIKRFIKSIAKKQRIEYLLLVGDVGKIEIPTNYVYTYFGGVTASDFPYSLDGKIAVGRIPTQNYEKLNTIISKIIAYETQGGLWQHKVHFVAGQGDFGAAIDSFCELVFKKLVASYMPTLYQLKMMYANPNSPFFELPKKFMPGVLRRFGEGGLFFVYVGHGNYDRFADISHNKRRYPMLRKRDVQKMYRGNTFPPVVSIACDTAYFDHHRECLGEKMLFHPFGCSLFIGSSRISHPYANALVGKALLKGLFVKKSDTVGKLMCNVYHELKFPPRFDFLQILIDGGAKMFTIGTPLRDLNRIRREHCYLYGILGDPATRIRYPKNVLSIKMKKKYDEFLVLGVTSKVNIPVSTKMHVSVSFDLLGAETSSLAVHDQAIFETSKFYENGELRIPIKNLKPGKYYIRVCMVIQNDCLVGTYLYSKGKTNGN
ncbi:C25 family cysteine peptidase [Candidatus Uabimicrobium amorphum]|uniref:Peptidase C25 n=1 Tax=Uabimicrobium amorphum TaxID=2596890 RepID=A0A5S9IKE8_UABAM|nr:C25 family cysteine peptidase [Candidatus Uabimicrobium amorphum]BBM83157.1 peptidase C25 [Candidatus Uabimicrobium amorphum]